MSKCFGAREAEDILNMCPKTKVCSVWFAEIIIPGFPAATDMAPEWLQGSWGQAGCAVPMDAGHGGEQEQLQGCCPSLSSSKLEREMLTTRFLTCGANSVTSHVHFPTSLFINFFFLISWAVLRYEIRRAEMILKETEPSLQGNLIPKLSLD